MKVVGQAVLGPGLSGCWQSDNVCQYVASCGGAPILQVSLGPQRPESVPQRRPQPLQWVALRSMYHVALLLAWKVEPLSDIADQEVADRRSPASESSWQLRWVAQVSLTSVTSHITWNQHIPEVMVVDDQGGLTQVRFNTLVEAINVQGVPDDVIDIPKTLLTMLGPLRTWRDEGTAGGSQHLPVQCEYVPHHPCQLILTAGTQMFRVMLSGTVATSEVILTLPAEEYFWCIAFVHRSWTRTHPSDTYLLAATTPKQVLLVDIRHPQVPCLCWTHDLAVAPPSLLQPLPLASAPPLTWTLGVSGPELFPPPAANTSLDQPSTSGTQGRPPTREDGPTAGAGDSVPLGGGPNAVNPWCRLSSPQHPKEPEGMLTAKAQPTPPDGAAWHKRDLSAGCTMDGVRSLWGTLLFGSMATGELQYVDYWLTEPEGPPSCPEVSGPSGAIGRDVLEQSGFHIGPPPSRYFSSGPPNLLSNSISKSLDPDTLRGIEEDLLLKWAQSRSLGTARTTTELQGLVARLAEESRTLLRAAPDLQGACAVQCPVVHQTSGIDARQVPCWLLRATVLGDLVVQPLIRTPLAPGGNGPQWHCRDYKQCAVDLKMTGGEGEGGTLVSPDVQGALRDAQDNIRVQRYQGRKGADRRGHKHLPLVVHHQYFRSLCPSYPAGTPSATLGEQHGGRSKRRRVGVTLCDGDMVPGSEQHADESAENGTTQVEHSGSRQQCLSRPGASSAGGTEGTPLLSSTWPPPPLLPEVSLMISKWEDNRYHGGLEEIQDLVARQGGALMLYELFACISEPHQQRERPQIAAATSKHNSLSCPPHIDMAANVLQSIWTAAETRRVQADDERPGGLPWKFEGYLRGLHCLLQSVKDLVAGNHQLSRDHEPLLRITTTGPRRYMQTTRCPSAAAPGGWSEGQALGFSQYLQYLMSICISCEGPCTVVAGGPSTSGEGTLQQGLQSSALDDLLSKWVASSTSGKSAAVPGPGPRVDIRDSGRVLSPETVYMTQKSEYASAPPGVGLGQGL